MLFPQRAQGGCFEEPTGASKRQCSIAVGWGEVARNESGQFVDFENSVRHVRGKVVEITSITL